MQAHLSSSSYSKTTIFDYVAQEALDGLLYSACKKVYEGLISRNRFYFSYYDEVYLLSSLLVQNFCVRKYGASLSECLYNLKRIGVNGNELTQRQILLSLLSVTLAPYLKRKLNKKAEEILFNEDSSVENKKSKIISATSRGLEVTLTLTKILQLLRFLTGKSQAQSPFLWMLNIKLALCQEDDASGGFMGHFRRAVEILAFFLQSVQWSRTNMASNRVDKYIALPRDDAVVTTAEDKDCPLCHHTRNAPTALSVSGYVFCFHCIKNFVSQKNKCPITNLPASLLDLVRLSV